MLVAVCDQSGGTSTSRCSKITDPLSFPIEAVRVSQVISSYGVLPGSSLAVKYRENAMPVFVLVVVLGSNTSIFAISVATCPIEFSSASLFTNWNDSVILPQYVVSRQGIYLYAVPSSYGNEGFKRTKNPVENHRVSEKSDLPVLVMPCLPQLAAAHRSAGAPTRSPAPLRIARTAAPSRRTHRRSRLQPTVIRPRCATSQSIAEASLTPVSHSRHASSSSSAHRSSQLRPSPDCAP